MGERRANRPRTEHERLRLDALTARRRLKAGKPLRPGEAELLDGWDAEQATRLDELRATVDSGSRECIRTSIPGTERRRPAVKFQGRTRPAALVALIMATGEDRSHEGFQAAHRCLNWWCVNPRHLRWATRDVNLAEKARFVAGAGQLDIPIDDKLFAALEIQAIEEGLPTDLFIRRVLAERAFGIGV